MNLHLNVHFDFHEKEVKEAVDQALMGRYMKIGLAVEREAKMSMKKGGGKAHVPSQPGTPPHKQLGTLQGSITTARDEEKKTVVVGPTPVAWYGRLHEYGGTFTGRVRTVTFPQRAFMHPALDKVTRASASRQLENLNLASTKAGSLLNRQRDPKTGRFIKG